LWTAIEKAGTLNGVKVRQAVLTTPFKKTIMGDVKCNQDGTAIFPEPGAAMDAERRARDGQPEQRVEGSPRSAVEPEIARDREDEPGRGFAQGPARRT